MLSVVDRRRLLDGALSVWRDRTDIIKSVVRSRCDVASQEFVSDASTTSLHGATSGVADTELSRRSHLRPDGPTSASRSPVHRTWNQRVRLSVFQHLSTS